MDLEQRFSHTTSLPGSETPLPLDNPFIQINHCMQELEKLNYQAHCDGHSSQVQQCLINQLIPHSITLSSPN